MRISAPRNLGLEFNGCYDDWMMPLIRGRLGRSLPALLFLGTVVVPLAAEGAADDLKVVDGVLSQPLLLPDQHIAEIATESGATYYVDLRALPRNQVRLQAQTAVTVVGYEGDRPDVISAHTLKVRETPPPVPVGHSSVDLRVIEGKVASMTREALMLRTFNGAMVMVRVAGSSARFISGEMVRVLGVLGRDKTFTASALIVLSPLQSDVRANKKKNDQ
jgi:hypothetical protein